MAFYLLKKKMYSLSVSWQKIRFDYQVWYSRLYRVNDVFPQALWWVWRVTLASVCTVPVKLDWRDSLAPWQRKLLPGIYEWTWWLQVVCPLFFLLLLLLLPINLHISCHMSALTRPSQDSFWRTWRQRWRRKKQWGEFHWAVLGNLQRRPRLSFSSWSPLTSQDRFCSWTEDCDWHCDENVSWLSHRSVKVDTFVDLYLHIESKLNIVDHLPISPWKSESHKTV